jgi:hypothetical protein
MHYREAVACEFSPEKIHVGEYDDFLAEAVDRIPALQLMIDSPSPPKEKYCFARLKVDKKGPSRDASAEEYDLIKKSKSAQRCTTHQSVVAGEKEIKNHRATRENSLQNNKTPP